MFDTTNPMRANRAPVPLRYLAWLQKWWWRLDARWYQIVFLLSFLLVGVWARDFALRPRQLALAVGVALLTQAAWQWALRLPTRAQWVGYLSALVSSLGLGILVRSQYDWPFALLTQAAWQ
jgi:hypothetical protein